MAYNSSKRARGIRQNVRPVNLTTNIGGMVENKADRFLDITQAVDIVNMHPQKQGSWTTYKIGYTNINSSAYESGAILNGIAWYIDSSLANHVLFAANGKLLEANESTGISTVQDAGAGYSTTGNVDFQQLDNKMYSCDGTISKPRVWDGASGADSAGWPVDGIYSKPKYVEVHNDRSAYSNFDGFPSHIAISNFSDPEAFTLPALTSDDAYVAEVGVGDGQTIRGQKSIFLADSNESALAIFKDRSTYVTLGDSPLETDDDPFRIIKINANYGVLNNHAVVQVGNDLWAIGELPGGGYGVISYTTSIQAGTLQPSVIDDSLVLETFERININALDECWTIHLAKRREIWFGLALDANTQVKDFLVFKYPKGPTDTPKWFRRSMLGHGCGMVYRNRMLFGTYNGYISDFFTSSTANGAAIPFQYEYPYTDLGNERQYKRILDARAHFNVPVTQRVTMKTQWLGGGNNNVSTRDIDLDAGTGLAVYGTAIYGTSRFGEQVELKRQFKIDGNGERLKITLSGNTTASGGPEYLGTTLLVEYGGISQHWR